MKIGIFYANIKDAYTDISDDLTLLCKAKEAGYSYIDIDFYELIEKPDSFFAEAEKLSIGFSVYVFSDENCVFSNGTNAVDCLPFLSNHNVKNLMMACMPSDKSASPDLINSAIVGLLNALCEEASQFVREALSC